MFTVPQIFQPYKGRKIAIYGLSLLTKEILPWAEQECSVIGLLDGCQVSGELYEKPIISLEAAIQEGAALILVAARPESCKIITKRIEEACRAYHIDLMDNKGNNLLAEKPGVYDFKNVDGTTREQLLHAISQHDAVSTDLFDTLVMRRTLFQTDVFEMVDQRLRQRGIVIEDFSAKRTDGEKELCRRMFPTLVEIYSYIRDKYDISDLQPEEAAEIEWNVDYTLLVPRKELCTLLQTVYSQGKPVYIVTDTFYTKEQLTPFLNKCGITCYTDILSSCNFRTSKPVGLFQCLQKKLSGKSCIHIGDSMDTDVAAAKANGITGWRIYSGLDLFEQIGYLGTWNAISTINSRIQLGMFVSRLFNSPFQFESGRSRITVEQARDIGYLFFAPVITSFVFWFQRQVHQKDLKSVWFCARDGYLIQELYEQLDSTVPVIYFLTSRTAAIRAAIENREDIRYIEEMRFSGTLQEQLKERFGIETDTQDQRLESKCLLAYEQEILAAAAVYRKNYCSYLDQLKIPEGSAAFFDFVARGTVQMYVRRLVGNHLSGLYFMQQDPEYMRKNDLDILPYYQNEEAENSAIASNYYMLETVLTSGMPSVIGFDSDGSPVYGEETRAEADLRCIEAMQDGIREYFQSYLELAAGGPEDRKVGELLLSLVHHITITDDAFQNLKVEDPFFNRYTALSEIL